MAYQSAIFFLTTLLLLASSSAHAKPLTPSTHVLRGHEAETELFVDTNSAFLVRLHTSRSDALIVERSYVSVSLNDLPVATLKLSEVPSVFELSLKPTQTGFQKITISTILVVDAEPCSATYNTLAWFTIESSSELVPSELAEPTLSDRVEALRDVSWVFRGYTEAEELLAEIGVERGLARNGWSRAQPDSKEPDRFVVANKTPRLTNLVESIADREVGSWDVALLKNDYELLMIGDAKNASRVLRNLRKRISSCGDLEVCFWRLPETESGNNENEKLELAVWKMGEGAPGGWKLSGVESEFSFSWTVPKAWTLQAFPQFQFNVVRSATIEVEVYVNGQLVDRFEPKKRKADIAVTIPERFWGDESWTISLRGRRTDDQKTCGADGTFAFVAPTAALIVPRKQALYSSFGSTFSGDVTVTKSVSIDPKKAAQIIAPAIKPSAEVFIAESCSQSCVHFVSSDYFESRYPVAFSQNDNTSKFPIAEKRNLLLAERGGSVWNVFLGKRADGSELYLQANAAVGLWNETWVTLRKAEPAEKVVDVVPMKTLLEATELGARAESSRWVNVATAIVIMLIAAGTIFTIWRRKDPEEALFE